MIDTITILATWGAVVSTGLGAIRTHEYWRDRKAQVKVYFETTVITPLLGVMSECCEIRAVNRGKRPITIAALALQLSDGRTLNPMHLDCYSRHDLPVTLTESQGLSAFLRKNEVDLDNVAWAFARANDGTIYKSRPLSKE